MSRLERGFFKWKGREFWKIDIKEKEKAIREIDKASVDLNDSSFAMNIVNAERSIGWLPGTTTYLKGWMF